MIGQVDQRCQTSSVGPTSIVTTPLCLRVVSPDYPALPTNPVFLGRSGHQEPLHLDIPQYVLPCEDSRYFSMVSKDSLGQIMLILGFRCSQSSPIVLYHFGSSQLDASVFWLRFVILSHKAHHGRNDVGIGQTCQFPNFTSPSTSHHTAIPCRPTRSNTRHTHPNRFQTPISPKKPPAHTHTHTTKTSPATRGWLHIFSCPMARRITYGLSSTPKCTSW